MIVLHRAIRVLRLVSCHLAFLSKSTDSDPSNVFRGRLPQVLGFLQDLLTGLDFQCTEKKTVYCSSVAAGFEQAEAL